MEPEDMDKQHIIMWYLSHIDTVDRNNSGTDNSKTGETIRKQNLHIHYLCFNVRYLTLSLYHLISKNSKIPENVTVGSESW